MRKQHFTNNDFATTKQMWRRWLMLILRFHNAPTLFTKCLTSSSVFGFYNPNTRPKFSCASVAAYHCGLIGW